MKGTVLAILVMITFHKFDLSMVNMEIFNFCDLYHNFPMYIMKYFHACKKK